MSPCVHGFKVRGLCPVCFPKKGTIKEMFMREIPQGWSSDPSRHALTCDRCQQSISYMATEQGHTLNHYPDGRWVTVEHPIGEGLCPSSPAYAKPLEVGLRELVVNHMGASVPVVPSPTLPSRQIRMVTHDTEVTRGDWYFVAVAEPTLADCCAAIGDYMGRFAAAPKRLEVRPEDFCRLSNDCAAMRPWATPKVKTWTDEELADVYSKLDRDRRAAFRARTCLLLPGTGTPVDLENFTNEQINAEFKRRWPGTSAIGAKFLEDMQRLMPPEVGAFSDVQFKERVDQLLATEREAKAIADGVARLGAFDVRFDPPKFDSCVIKGVRYVAPEKHPGCKVCGSASGEKCTKACDDDRIPDGLAHMDNRTLHGYLESGASAVAALPPMRPDNSVAHLDEDLLADDA